MTVAGQKGVKTKMPKPVAKAKKKKTRSAEIQKVFSAKEQRKLEREADNALIDLEEEVEQRYKYARKIYDKQDEQTQAAIDHLIGTMEKMAGPPVFIFRGIRMNADTDQHKTIQQKNFMWIAVRLLVACARWDIKIANFKLSKQRCADCGKKVK